jgi:hypothetical protein
MSRGTSPAKGGQPVPHPESGDQVILFDDLLRRMIEMPPKPHEQMKLGRDKRARRAARGSGDMIHS